jgi:hypothetical protein
VRRDRRDQACEYSAVIPAKAGTHVDFQQKEKWIPAFAGMTDANRSSIEASSVRDCPARLTCR